MKALVLEEYMQLTYKDVPDPDVRPGEVLIRVRAAGICGSDVHGIDGSTGRRIPPIIMGHEASGEIVRLGDQVTDWQVGDRVTFDSTIYRLDDWFSRKGMYNLSDGRKVLGVSTEEFKCDGAFAEYVAIPEHILYGIPDNVSFTQAALVEPAAVALHAVSLSPAGLNNTAIVVGAGMVGSFVIQLLNLAGFAEIIAVDLEEDRLKLATELGATSVLNPGHTDVVSETLKMTEGRGVGIAFDVVGNSGSFGLAVSCIRKGGSLILIGNISPRVELPLQLVVTRQLCLQGSYAINGEYPAVLDMLSTGKINADKILSREVPLSEGAVWFKKLYNKEKGLMKVVLIP